MDIQDKVVLVTGASAGIGLAAAQRFAREGAKVALVARSAEKLETISHELRDSIALPADMRSEPDVDRVVEAAYNHYGRIDILINNAAQSARGNVSDVKPDYFRQIIDLNILGALYAIQAVVPKMRLHGGGLIINVSSPVYKWHVPGLGAYSATKAALDALSDTARAELAPDNIRVVTFYPGLIATDLGNNALGEYSNGARTNLLSPQPLEEAIEKLLEAAQKEPEVMYSDERYAVR